MLDGRCVAPSTEAAFRVRECGPRRDPLKRDGCGDNRAVELLSIGTDDGGVKSIAWKIKQEPGLMDQNQALATCCAVLCPVSRVNEFNRSIRNRRQELQSDDHDAHGRDPASARA